MAETPSLEKIIQKAIDLAVTELRVSLPGIVERYDADKQLVDVQPAIMKKYAITAQVVKLPLITNVPVAHPRAGDTIVHLPIKKGDIVQLVFSDRSMDRWLSEGGVVDPLEGRKHHLSDAWAIPGGYPFANPHPVEDPEALEIYQGDSLLRLKDGKFALKSLSSGDELLAILVSLLEELIAARTVTSLGPQPLVGAGFGAIKGKLEGLKE